VQLKETGPAVEAFEKARQLAPQETPAYFGLGLLYMQNGEVDKALEAYREGLARDAEDTAANQNYALLLMGKGGFREAVEPLLRLKRMNGGDVRQLGVAGRRHSGARGRSRLAPGNHATGKHPPLCH